jgi:hypothetical protein
VGDGKSFESPPPVQPMARPTMPRSTEPTQPSPPMQPPKLTFPQGGASIRGMGESLQPVSLQGTGLFQIPLPTTPARGLQLVVQVQPGLRLIFDSTRHRRHADRAARVESAAGVGLRGRSPRRAQP